MAAIFLLNIITLNVFVKKENKRLEHVYLILEMGVEQTPRCFLVM